MDHHSTLEHDSSPLSVDAAVPQNGANVSAIPTPETVSAHGSHPIPHFPGEDVGHTLAQIAQRDLDAALQLLAERAQYITRATGAAIAVRRGEHNDMVCRASVGSNAPALGALLSAETGLSGESVRGRLPLRCDDAERDPRVNREGCRELGIASVAVMPIVSDEQVLGVFELFSGKVNAFDERDLSALQRLGEMVETAVKLAKISPEPPLEVRSLEVPSPEIVPAAVVTTENPAVVANEAAAPKPELEADAGLPPAALQEASASQIPAPQPASEVPPPEIPAPQIPEAQALATDVATPGGKPLFWTAAAASFPSAAATPEADKSHVPPVLRNLHKCHTCGFPVSEGRQLCVECEEKRWRGQLRVPSPQSANTTPADVAKLARPAIIETKVQEVSTLASPVVSVPKDATASVRAKPPVAPVPVVSAPRGKPQPAPASAGQSFVPPVLNRESQRIAPPPPFLTAGIGQSESWLSKHKYFLVVVAIVAIVVAVIVLVH